MAKFPYTKGLHDLGNGCFAYLQPNGGWGWSNAGLVVDGRNTLLVDTLFDLPLTRAMLAAMRAAVPAAATIDTVVNTHSNGDHTYGNQLVAGAEIIASTACFEEMREQGEPLAPGGIRRNWRAMGEAGAFFQEVMGSRFDWDGIALTLPTRRFDGALTVQVGGKAVRLIEVGPAHTRGDVIVHVPADRTVFTGDMLFVGGHPLVWAGPVGNWIKACELMLGWDVETVVPGHGPITDKAGIRALKQYFEDLLEKSRPRFAAGMTAEQAAHDIARDRAVAWADWIDPERLVVNVAACYRDFRGEQAAPDMMAVRASMARAYFARKATAESGRTSSA
jgi:glyoxylase-like metal-dependent hydrolase (beta-lactamase superfamily II)